MTAKNMLHKDGAALFTTNRDAYNKLRAIGQSKLLDLMQNVSQMIHYYRYKGTCP